MPLVFAGIMPHPPIFIPGVSKQNLTKNTKLKKAVLMLEQDLYSAKPDTIIIISPHGAAVEESFMINHAPVLRLDFSDFGDLETTGEFKNDLSLGYQLREKTESSLPVILSSEDKLDYGTAIPLYYLTAHLKNIGVIPLTYSILDRGAHLALGRAIRQTADKSSKRVAVIASADLSHRLKKNSPDGYAPQGKEYDQLVIDLLGRKKNQEFIELNEDLIKNAGQCGYQGILMLLGAINEINYQAKVIGYDNSLGVGYLVMNFEQ
ncbi:MAG: AmmeMemoRadiSam system protein B [Candidatus Komeilibacteria bacterium]|nr:AmmeMemoRadiSam system protein B [Candidatus Komeilibacteria bacterium]